jgi:hypothetical protein
MCIYCLPLLLLLLLLLLLQQLCAVGVHWQNIPPLVQ